MSASAITSTKPYLLRAIFEWAEDCGFTPQVLVNAAHPDVEVPREHVVDGQIVLNISSNAVQLHVMDNDCLSFSARFSGVERDIFLPMASILAIFARENSQGIFFEELDEAEEQAMRDEESSEPDLTAVPSTGKDRGQNQGKNRGKDGSPSDDEPPSTPPTKPKSGQAKPAKKKGSHLKIIK